MRWIEISRAERDVLRDEAKRQGGCFADLQAMAEGTAPPGAQRFSAVKVLALLNDIGWELRGDEETYRLRQSGKIIGFLAGARAGTTDQRVVDVCVAILSRESFSDPVLDEALALARATA